MDYECIILWLPAKEQKTNHIDFRSAFERMYNEMVEIMKTNTTWMLIETGIMIKEKNSVYPMDWYTSRDRAYNEGILKDGILTIK
jgi:hypothetical protein